MFSVFLYETLPHHHDKTVEMEKKLTAISDFIQCTFLNLCNNTRISDINHLTRSKFSEAEHYANYRCNSDTNLLASPIANFVLSKSV